MAHPSTITIALLIVLAAATHTHPAHAVELWREATLEDFAKPGKYGMGTFVASAPKASMFRASYGTAPVSVFYPTLPEGGGDPNALADDGETFHAIGFAHGAGASADWYTNLYRHLVSHGFVIVSVRNMAPVPATLGDDMCHGLAWIIAESLGNGTSGRGSAFFGRVDADAVGVAGHSMGGGGSMVCATQWPQKVKALAPIHPAPGAPASLVYVPMMVPTGAMDFVTSPMLVKASVYDGSPSPKIMPVMNGVGHREPNGKRQVHGTHTRTHTRTHAHLATLFPPSLPFPPIAQASHNPPTRIPSYRFPFSSSLRDRR